MSATSFISLRYWRASVEDTALISGDHVLDIDEGVFSTCLLEELQSFADQIAEVQSLALTVLHFVATVDVTISEDVEDGQYLSIVGHQCLANHLSAQDEFLDYF